MKKTFKLLNILVIIFSHCLISCESSKKSEISTLQDLAKNQVPDSYTAKLIKACETNKEPQVAYFDDNGFALGTCGPTSRFAVNYESFILRENGEVTTIRQNDTKLGLNNFHYSDFNGTYIVGHLNLLFAKSGKLLGEAVPIDGDFHVSTPIITENGLIFGQANGLDGQFIFSYSLQEKELYLFDNFTGNITDVFDNKVIGHFQSGISSTGFSADLGEGNNSLVNINRLKPFNSDIVRVAAINSNKAIVGNYRYQGSSEVRAYAYHKDYGEQDLGSFDGEFASASDINNDGIIVGSSTGLANQFRAFVTDLSRTNILDLNELIVNDIPYLRRALKINNKGQIIATSDLNFYILTPN